MPHKKLPRKKLPTEEEIASGSVVVSKRMQRRLNAKRQRENPNPPAHDQAQQDEAAGNGDADAPAAKMQKSEDQDESGTGGAATTATAKTQKQKKKEKRKQMMAARNRQESDSRQKKGDTFEIAKELLEKVITPLKCDDFFETYWQTHTIFVKGSAQKCQNLFADLMTWESFQEILQKNDLEYTKNINVARCVDGLRETMPKTGKATLNDIRKYVEKEGWSLQIVNPQLFSEGIYRMCATLQELFGCFVGANVYITPPGSQGFAPHWDDIDAFVLQVQGRKLWKVHGPSDDSENLPLESSYDVIDRDLTEEESASLPMVFEGWLEPGDVLYMPRGRVHYAVAPTTADDGEQAASTKADDVMSVHITVSMSRRASYVDMALKLIPEILQNPEFPSRFRKSPPIGYFSHLGVNYAGSTIPNSIDVEADVKKTMVELIGELAENICEMTDAGCDMMASEYLEQTMPLPADLVKPLPAADTKLEYDTKIRFIGRHSQRLLHGEDDQSFLAFNHSNAREFGANETADTEFRTVAVPDEEVGGIQTLIETYPDYVKVADLKCEGEKENKMKLARKLLDKKLLLVETAE